jgi:cytochrome P450
MARSPRDPGCLAYRDLLRDEHFPANRENLPAVNLNSQKGDAHRQKRLLLSSLASAAACAFLYRFVRGSVADLLSWPNYELSECAGEIAARIPPARFSLDIAARLNPPGQTCDRGNTTHPTFLRFPLHPLSRRASQNMDESCSPLIRQQRAKNAGTGELLSLRMRAGDEETGAEMSEQERRAEFITLPLAGQEASAQALAWTMHLPDKLERALNGHVPTIENLAHLPSTRMVFEEPAWSAPPSRETMHHNIVDDEPGGYHIPAGSSLFWSQDTVHRQLDGRENREEDHLERFPPDAVVKRQNYAASLVETVSAGKPWPAYRFKMPPGVPSIKPGVLLTLHPSLFYAAAGTTQPGGSKQPGQACLLAR